MKTVCFSVCLHCCNPWATKPWWHAMVSAEHIQNILCTCQIPNSCQTPSEIKSQQHMEMPMSAQPRRGIGIVRKALQSATQLSLLHSFEGRESQHPVAFPDLYRLHVCATLGRGWHHQAGLQSASKPSLLQRPNLWGDLRHQGLHRPSSTSFPHHEINPRTVTQHQATPTCEIHTFNNTLILFPHKLCIGIWK